MTMDSHSLGSHHLTFFSHTWNAANLTSSFAKPTEGNVFHLITKKKIISHVKIKWSVIIMIEGIIAYYPGISIAANQLHFRKSIKIKNYQIFPLETCLHIRLRARYEKFFWCHLHSLGTRRLVFCKLPQYSLPNRVNYWIRRIRIYPPFIEKD